VHGWRRLITTVRSFPDPVRLLQRRPTSQQDPVLFSFLDSDRDRAARDRRATPTQDFTSETPQARLDRPTQA